MHNAFRPVFNGLFQIFDNRVILLGKMEMDAVGLPLCRCRVGDGLVFTLGTMRIGFSPQSGPQYSNRRERVTMRPKDDE